MLYGSLDGSGIWGRMDTCICMAESLCSSPETITTLLTGYTSIQNKKLKNKQNKTKWKNIFKDHKGLGWMHTQVKDPGLSPGALIFLQFSSVPFSRSIMSDSLRPHESQHARPPCRSPTPGVHSDLRPSSP